MALDILATYFHIIYHSCYHYSITLHLLCRQGGGQVYMWQGFQGNVELVSYTTFLSRPVRRVALGADHSLVLTTHGEVYALGSNSHGQLGIPTLNSNYTFDPCCIAALAGKLN